MSYILVCVHFIVCSIYVCSCSTPSFSSLSFPVRHFPVLQIPPLRLRPSFSSPANSTPAISSVIFQSCKFQSCKFSYPVRTMFDELLANCRARLEVNSWLVGASSMASMWRVSSQMNRNEYQYVTLVTGDWMSPLSATTVHIT